MEETKVKVEVEQQEEEVDRLNSFPGKWSERTRSPAKLILSYRMRMEMMPKSEHILDGLLACSRAKVWFGAYSNPTSQVCLSLHLHLHAVLTRDAWYLDGEENRRWLPPYPCSIQFCGGLNIDEVHLFLLSVSETVADEHMRASSLTTSWTLRQNLMTHSPNIPPTKKPTFMPITYYLLHNDEWRVRTFVVVSTPHKLYQSK